MYSVCSMFMYLFVLLRASASPPVHSLTWVQLKKIRIFMCFWPCNRQFSTHDGIVCREWLTISAKFQEVNSNESLTFAATVITINVCICECKFYLHMQNAKAPMAIFGYALHFLFTLRIFSPAISRFFVLSYSLFLLRHCTWFEQRM